MKRLNCIKTKNNKNVILITTAMTVLFMNSHAHAQILDKANKALKALQTDLIGHIIPIAAAVILLCLAIGYAGRYIGRDTFVRWAIGVVISGSATELTTMLFTSN
ncbi:VirB2 family type IV secretion system major pilin TrwL [Bartonella taylorii]|uniref:VirB2 family type IV secretion system major pilin TrwL n=1 Tax=Bartonella taylorii TaxID=33046 RepID=UPI001ABA5716|nr:VirB2 family type IV secretion system major pilin TrwL [Bartonella taylorii]